jgi:23S rRNA pseudouridine2605 synthase
MPQRLQKILAQCGVGSRRECETLIEQGRVEVDGKVVTKLGTKIDPEAVDLKVDGERVKREERVYYVLNKPRGYVSTNRDERGRPRVVDLVRDERRIYTVGRLDEQSEGLILLTNDGGLANIICHPRYQVDKSYRITVRGRVSREQAERLEQGVWLAEGKTGPARIKKIDSKGTRSVMHVTLWEGRNRELRRMLGKVGLKVTHLVRTAIGPLRVEGLPPGRYRRLRETELGFARERMSEGWTPRPVPETRPRQSARRTHGR